MEVYVILAQITGIIGWLLLVYSYYKDDIDKLLFVQIISSIFYCINYFLLGAYSGLLVCFIELLKGIGYYKTDKDDFIFLFSLPIYGLLAFFTFNGIASLLPVAGSIIDGFSQTKNKNIATFGSIIANILWVIYDVIIIAYACALTDGILVLSNISILLLGYSRILKINKLRIVYGKTLSKNIYTAINKLDEKTYGKEYTWSYDYEKKLSSQNKESLLLLKYNNEIVGYLNYYVLNEEEHHKVINSPEMIKEYDINNVIKFRKTRKNYLIIDSINIKNSFHDPLAVNLIYKKLKRIIRKKYKEGYKIDEIISVAMNKFEKDVLETAGFTKYKEYLNNKDLYILDDKTINELYLK